MLATVLVMFPAQNKGGGVLAREDAYNVNHVVTGFWLHGIWRKEGGGSDSEFLCAIGFTRGFIQGVYSTQVFTKCCVRVKSPGKCGIVQYPQ